MATPFDRNRGLRHSREARTPTPALRINEAKTRRHVMNEQIVEVLSRRAASSMSRRGSLVTLGGALAAAITAPSLVQAKKGSKKGKKTAKRKAAQRAENEANLICQSQDAGCRAHVLNVCQGEGGFCIAAVECCSSLGECDVTGFFACLAALA
jgi:hypothetical protein